MNKVSDQSGNPNISLAVSSKDSPIFSLKCSKNNDNQELVCETYNPVLSPIFKYDKPESPIFLLNTDVDKSKPIIVQGPPYIKEAPAGNVRMLPSGFTEDGEQLANFTVAPIQKLVQLEREGKEIANTERFASKVSFDDGSVGWLEVYTPQIHGLAKLILDKFSYAVIGYRQEALAARAIERAFREATKTVPVCYLVKEAGWNWIQGKPYYLHDDAVVPKGYRLATGKSLPNQAMYAGELRDVFQRALALLKDQQAIQVMVLYSLTGILFRCLLETDFNFAPHFLLFIVGRSGTMKTTISKILYIQLCEVGRRESARRISEDTPTSFEVAVSKSGYDTTLLLDDYAPPKTKQAKNRSVENLERVVRMVGDGNLKSRSNAELEDRQGERVQGTVVVTGEIKGQGTSSNLRCLYVEIHPHTANVEMVTWFQQNKEAYPSFLNYFAAYVGKYWDMIQNWLPSAMNRVQEEMDAYFSEPRLAKTAGILCVIADILGGFLMECCVYERVEAEQLVAEIRKSVIDVALESMRGVKQESYSLLFIKGLHNLILTNKLSFCMGKPADGELLGEYAGYIDGDYYYIYLPACYTQVKNYLQAEGRCFPFTRDEVANELYQDGLSVPSKNGKLRDGRQRKNCYHRIMVKDKGTRINYVKIRRCDFELAAGCEDAQEYEEIFKFNGGMREDEWKEIN